MLREILWLDSGDTLVIRGTGTQIQYNCVTLNQTLFVDNVFQLFYTYVQRGRSRGGQGGQRPPTFIVLGA